MSQEPRSDSPAGAAGGVVLGSLADTVEIAPGVHMPRLGLGTYKADEGPDVEGEIRYGLSIGYRLIDTAALYANEHSVGKSMRESGVPRDEVFVTTKLWNSDQGYKKTHRAFDDSLSKLEMDYVDLYLIHWPIPQLLAETWRAMEEILASGRTRAIGVCNFLEHHIRDLLALAETPPALNQFEHHPRLQQRPLVDYCQASGVTVQAWAPVMRGRVCDIPELVAIAARHTKTPAQVSIRWILQEGVVTIPKSIHEPRIAENCDVYDFELTAEEMALIRGLDTGARIGPDPDSFGMLGGIGRFIPKMG
jgi:methylglyoxal/glyoxal reductase